MLTTNILYERQQTKYNCFIKWEKLKTRQTSSDKKHIKHPLGTQGDQRGLSAMKPSRRTWFLQCCLGTRDELC